MATEMEDLELGNGRKEKPNEETPLRLPLPLTIFNLVVGINGFLSSPPERGDCRFGPSIFLLSNSISLIGSVMILLSFLLDSRRTIMHRRCAPFGSLVCTGFTVVSFMSASFLMLPDIEGMFYWNIRSFSKGLIVATISCLV